MHKVFYQYAGFKDPVIDAQLVRTALDNWGWLWVGVECSVLWVLTSGIFLVAEKWMQSLASLGICLFVIVLAACKYRSCVKSAANEVRAILDDTKRRKDIRDALSALEKVAKGRKKRGSMGGSSDRGSS